MRSEWWARTELSCAISRSPGRGLNLDADRLPRLMPSDLRGKMWGTASCEFETTIDMAFEAFSDSGIVPTSALCLPCRLQVRSLWCAAP